MVDSFLAGLNIWHFINFISLVFTTWFLYQNTFNRTFNKNNWSLKDEQSYQKKATVFIDSIIKLRMIKN